MKKLNIFCGIITLVYLFVMSSSYVSGFDKEVICKEGGCSGFDGSLFSEENVYPGQSVKKSIKVKNEKDEKLEFTLSSNQEAGSDENFTKKATIVIYENGNVLFSDTFHNFFGKDIDLGEVEKGNYKLYEFEANFPSDSGNDYQGKRINFSLILNIKGEESGEEEVLSGTSSTGDSQGDVKSATTVNNSLIGQILGLSDTGFPRKIVNIFFLLIGVFFVLTGIRILHTRRVI